MAGYYRKFGRAKFKLIFMKTKTLTDKQGFPPIVADGAKLLILGSMPGEVSLQKQQYYGHPKNAFWAIMSALSNIPDVASYAERKSALMANGIAVWDVLYYCRRTGSLDANIDMDSVSINNFAHFFTAYPTIKMVCFNGGMAEKLYKKHVLPTVQAYTADIAYVRLPSTSSAYAAMTVAQKTQAWRSGFARYAKVAQPPLLSGGFL